MNKYQKVKNLLTKLGIPFNHNEDYSYWNIQNLDIWLEEKLNDLNLGTVSVNHDCFSFDDEEEEEEEEEENDVGIKKEPVWSEEDKKIIAELEGIWEFNPNEFNVDSKVEEIHGKTNLNHR